MSTKIYEGLRIDNMPLPEFNNWCMDIRRQIKGVSKAQFFKAVAKIAESIYLWQKTDMNLCPYYHGLDVSELLERKDNPKEWDKSSILCYSIRLASKIAKRSETAVAWIDSESDLDFAASLSVFPMQDKILVIPFATNPCIKEIITSNSKVHEYGYWNNTDHPSELSDEEWEQRKMDWDMVFKHSGIPAECGMTIHLFDFQSVDCWNAFDQEFIKGYILPHIRNDHDNCCAVAKQRILDRLWEEKKPKMEDGHEMSTMLEIEHYIKEHPELIENEAKSLFGTLDFQNFLLADQE